MSRVAPNLRRHAAENEIFLPVSSPSLPRPRSLARSLPSSGLFWIGLMDRMYGDHSSPFFPVITQRPDGRKQVKFQENHSESSKFESFIN